MSYNFDEVIDRTKSHSIKWDARRKLFGTEDVLPMWVADMDFKTPDFIIDAIRNRLDHEILGYTLRDEEYHQAIIDWMQKRHNWSIKKQWILYTPGVVPALNMAVAAFTQPGDKVILQPPVYHPFYMAIEDHGRHIVRNPLMEKDGRYFFDFKDLKRKIDKRTKLLLLSNPHNPGGRVWTEEELSELATICKKNNILIISDEIHSDLIFEPHEHIPLARISEEIADMTLTCMAPSKTFNLAGLASSSIIISNSKLRDQFETTLNSWHVYMGNIPGFVATTAAYREGEQWLKELLEYLKGNYDFVVEFIKTRIPKIKVMPLEATYLLWLDFRSYELEHKDLERKLVKEAKLGFNTGSMFGDEGKGFMRMNLAHPRIHVELNAVVEEIEHLSRNLRDNAISISLVPFATIFSRFQRLVHDLSKEFGKEIELKAEGMDTELDKTMIQTITDPLMHIIRNSIDHGIEDPKDRERKGKPNGGVIVMRALHSGANILIEVEDDGKGIDPQKIRAAAVRKGFLDASVDMPDSEVIKLILRPGFSTTEKATSVSGRGVGMDVVFQNVTSLKGALDIESEVGKGTVMRIRLPQSLSILDGMLVNISDTLFVVPSMVLLKIAPIKYNEVQEAHNKLLYIDEEHVPFLDFEN